MAVTLWHAQETALSEVQQVSGCSNLGHSGSIRHGALTVCVLGLCRRPFQPI